MADFCLQCNVDMWFGHESDFKDEARAHDDAYDMSNVALRCLCEGCGPILVGPQGECIEPGCTAHRPIEAYQWVDEWKAKRSGVLGPFYRLYDWWNGDPWNPGFKHYGWPDDIRTLYWAIYYGETVWDDSFDEQIPYFVFPEELLAQHKRAIEQSAQAFENFSKALSESGVIRFLRSH